MKISLLETWIIKYLTDISKWWKFRNGFSGLVNFTDDIIDFDFNTNIEKSNLFQLKLSKLTNTSLSGLITKLRGNDFENLIGDISFSNFKYQTDEIEYNFEELIAQSRINNDRRFFNILEDVVDGIIIGGLFFRLIKNYFYHICQNTLIIVQLI